MSADLDNIIRTCGATVSPGLADHIYAECVSDVLAIPAAEGDIVSTDITFSGTNGFVKWDTSGVLSKNTFKCETVGDVDNSSYKTTTSVFIPGTSAANQVILNGTKGCPHIFLVKDIEDNLRIVGSLTKGAYMTFVEDINDTVKGYTVTIEWDSSHPPYYYTGEITAAT